MTFMLASPAYDICWCFSIAFLLFHSQSRSLNVVILTTGEEEKGKIGKTTTEFFPFSFYDRVIRVSHPHLSFPMLLFIQAATSTSFTRLVILPSSAD